jgi:xanthine dehydrogenase small subunit
MAVRFVLNGEPTEVDDGDPHVTLLQWLRASGRTGSKEGCAEGECGACAVAVVRADARGRVRFESVNSCLVPLAAADGETLVTVEGVAARDGTLHPVQRAMVEAGGSQCGYCTPGFVVSLFCEFYRPGRLDFDPESIGGNLCRCTGYRPIADAGRALPAPAADDQRLPQAAPVLGAVDSGRFARPTSLEMLWRVRGERPGAVPIAGGTDLMVYANQKHQRFPALISLQALPELRHFSVDPTEITIGAGLTLSEIEERLGHGAAGDVAMLSQLWPLFSSRLIRNRATLGGNLATASPIGDASPALLALDAEVTLAGPRGERRLPLAQFFTGYRKTALAPDEIIVSVHLPRPLPAVQRFYKVSKRVLDDISTVAAAFALDLTADRRVERLRLAYGGIAATPIRAHAAEALAIGQPWNRETVAAIVAELARQGSPIDDHRGSAAYRRAMIGRLLEKFFAEVPGMSRW